jgi:PAS domain S-box-containing protein
MGAVSTAVEARDFALAVLEGMPNATVVVDEFGRIAFANRRVEQLLGWPFSELLGRAVGSLVPPSMRRRQTVLTTRFARRLDDESIDSAWEIDVLHRDGSAVPVEVNLSSFQFDGVPMVIVSLRDGRGQRDLRRALVDERDRAQAVIDSLQDGVLEFDLSGQRYTAANPRFCAMVGLSQAEVLASTGMPGWWHPDEAETIRALRENAAAGEVARYEIGLVHSSGSEFRALVTANLVHTGDQPTLLGLFHDLTDERDAVEELDAARSRVAILEDRDRIGRDLHDGVIQRLFAAGLHLQASIGRPDQDERTVGVIDEIDDAIKQIRTTVFTLHGQRGLSSGLQHALRVALSEAGRLLDHQPSLEIVGDARKVSDELGTELVSLVRELLANVVKHAAATRTFVRVSVGAAELTLQVADDGVGFDASVIEAGSGLKNLHERAEGHGGSAEVMARAPRGTIVKWTVPLV